MMPYLTTFFVESFAKIIASKMDPIYVNCFAKLHFSFMYSISDHLKQYKDYYVSRKNDNDFNVDLHNIDNRIVKLCITEELSRNDIDVCLVGLSIRNLHSSVEVRRHVLDCKKLYPNAPVVILCEDVEIKTKTDVLQRYELAGKKMVNQKTGNVLASEVGAVKYIEYSDESGRGAKLLIDEITYAGLEKLRSEAESTKKNPARRIAEAISNRWHKSSVRHSLTIK